MAIVKINITEDMLTLISNIHFKEKPNPKSSYYPMTWEIDLYSLYGGNFVYEDISLLLGRYDEHIKGTEEDVMGPRFEKEFEDYMFNLHNYIVDNLGYIENLIHYYAGKGGISVGTYKCHDDTFDWEKIE